MSTFFRTFFIRIFLLIFGSLAGICIAKAQVSSNSGTEFWATFPTHEPDFDNIGNLQLAKMSIFITGGQASSGTVSCGSFSSPFTISPNGVTEIIVPRNQSYIDINEQSTILQNRAIRIKVDDGKPKVVVYAHIYAGFRSAASLILPVQTLGNQYFSMNYKNVETEGKNFITIAAAEDNTRIYLRKNNTELIPGGVLLPHAGDVYEYLSDMDLTGALVSTDENDGACKRFALFTGNSGVKILYKDCDTRTLDPLYQQAYPVESWGNNYGYIPFSTLSSVVNYPVRTAGQLVRILARDDNTIININGSEVITLNRGGYYTTPTTLSQPAYITANHPISVAQYALSRGCSSYPDYASTETLGDPDMVLLNPVEYSIKDITIFSSSKENISEHFVNILIKTADAGSFRINGASPSAPFKPFNGMPGYSYLQLPLPAENSGSYHLSASGGFNAIAYGFGAAESYAYSAGTNLAATDKITGYSEVLQKEIDQACVDEDYYFKLTLPYISPRISWQFDVGATPVVQDAPAATPVTIDGRAAYTYRFPKPASYTSSGEHQVTILAEYGNGSCTSGYQEIDYNFRTNARPVVNFTAVLQDCFELYKFTDQSSGTAPLSYRWDFGDPASGSNNTSAAVEPLHRFSGSGTYQVSLTVGTDGNCEMTKIIPVTIRIFSPVLTAGTAACPGNPVSFKETSSSGTFAPVKWRWDFGDGSAVTLTTASQTDHVFNSGGPFTVKVTLINAAGCESNTAQIIQTIFPTVTAAFIAAESCSEDDFTNFTDQSVSADGSPLQYRWDFGDPTAAGNQSSDQNARHHFSSAGSYTVTLTVLARSGCRYSVSHDIIVNAPPNAGFEIVGGNQFCGSSLTVKNNSVISGAGNISKLEIYFDAAEQPAQVVTINTPQTGQLFPYTYPALTGNAPKTHLVRMVVYSANACSAQQDITVTQYPAPVLTFPVRPALCISMSPVQLQAAEQHNLAGSGIYSGLGVTPAGIFSPALAGKGTHEIRYTFTSDGGCRDFITQTLTVLDQPEVNDLRVSTTAGKPVKLQPFYQGGGLSYQWFPSTGLDDPTAAYPISSAADDVVYTVSISNGICSDDATVVLSVIDAPSVTNSFSPNGDGKNDLWKVGNLEPYPKTDIKVMNRYGIIVFQAKGPEKAWDGRFQGQDVPAGTYYYVIDMQNGKKPLSGYVVVLR